MIAITETEVTDEERDIIINLLKKHPEGLIPIINENVCGALIVFSKETSSDLYNESLKKDTFTMVMTLKIILQGVVFALLDMAKPKKLEAVAKDMINEVIRLKEAIMSMQHQESNKNTLN